MNASTFNHALESAFLWTLQTSLYATVLIALVFAVQLCFRKVLAPRWRYALSLLVALRLALPVVPQSAWSLFNLFQRANPSNATVPRETPLATTELSPPPVLEATAPNLLPPEPEFARPVSHPFRFGPSLKFIWLAGFVAMLSIVARQHRRFVLESRRWGAVTDPRVLGLLDECRAVIGIRRPLSILAATGLNTPALFGFWKPRLLMPQELLARLTDQELRHVFLHELLHLRRGDVLVNWAMILLRAVHWFNPAVWLAFRRLRADQELACDAAVMSRLAAPERRHYGSTLIKLLEDFSAQALCPGVVPFVTNKQVIKRRISMIAKFKPAGRLALSGSLALLAVLGCLTFTRAASEPVATIQTDDRVTAVNMATGSMPPVAAGAAGLPSTPPSGDAKGKSSEIQAAVEALAKVAQDMDNQVRDQEKKVDELRSAFHVVDTDPQSSGPGSSLGPMNIIQINSIKIQSENDAKKEEIMLAKLKSLDHEQLRMTLPRLIPDAILSQLLQEYMTIEAQLAFQMNSLGSEHPDIKKNMELKNKLDTQIDQQVAAILMAMETRIMTLRGQAKDADLQIEQARTRDIASAHESRPYWEAKAELERLRKTREVVMLRNFQEQIETRMASGMTGSTGQTAAASLRVVVQSDGTIRLGSSPNPVTLEQFKSAIAKEREKNPQVTLVLTSDSSVSYSAIKDILDTAQKAGIKSIYLTTDPLDKR